MLCSLLVVSALDSPLQSFVCSFRGLKSHFCIPGLDETLLGMSLAFRVRRSSPLSAKAIMRRNASRPLLCASVILFFEKELMVMKVLMGLFCMVCLSGCVLFPQQGHKNQSDVEMLQVMAPGTDSASTVLQRIA